MYWARHGRDGGLPKLVADLERYRADQPATPHWQPSSLLLSEARKGGAGTSARAKL